jgi:hypothetical protein
MYGDPTKHDHWCLGAPDRGVSLVSRAAWLSILIGVITAAVMLLTIGNQFSFPTAGLPRTPFEIANAELARKEAAAEAHEAQIVAADHETARLAAANADRAALARFQAAKEAAMANMRLSIGQAAHENATP